MIDILYQILESKGFKVVYTDLHSRHPQLEAYTDFKRKRVVLDKSLLERPRQLKCVLAEETGHVLYPPPYNTISYHMAEYWDIDALGRSKVEWWHSKSERAAMLWATDFIIPDRDFWAFTNSGSHELWEFAEHFEVEKWFIQAKIGFIRVKEREKGVKLKWMDIIRKTPMVAESRGHYGRPPKGGFGV